MICERDTFPTLTAASCACHWTSPRPPHCTHWASTWPTFAHARLVTTCIVSFQHIQASVSNHDSKPFLNLLTSESGLPLARDVGKNCNWVDRDPQRGNNHRTLFHGSPRTIFSSGSRPPSIPAIIHTHRGHSRDRTKSHSPGRGEERPR